MKNSTLLFILCMLNTVAFGTNEELINNTRFKRFEENFTVKMLLAQNSKLSFVEDSTTNILFKKSNITSINNNFEQVYNAFQNPMHNLLEYAINEDNAQLRYNPQKEEDKNKRLASTIILHSAALGLEEVKNILEKRVEERVEEGELFSRKDFADELKKGQEPTEKEIVALKQKPNNIGTFWDQAKNADYVILSAGTLGLVCFVYSVYKDKRKKEELSNIAFFSYQ